MTWLLGNIFKIFFSVLLRAFRMGGVTGVVVCVCTIDL